MVLVRAEIVEVIDVQQDDLFGVDLEEIVDDQQIGLDSVAEQRMARVDLVLFFRVFRNADIEISNASV